jgi:hypothetical protein
MCADGLHASRRLIDALRYAPGSRLHRVECANVVEEVADKLLCRRRRILWSLDADGLLREFARMCALDVFDMIRAPTAALEILAAWLVTGDESFRAAAYSAARSAAYSAADIAADIAADFEACVAAHCAAHNAADVADRTFQNRRLTRMVMAAHREALIQ